MAILLVSPFIDRDSVGEPRWCYDLAKALSDRAETVVVSQTPRNRDYRIADLLPNSKVYEHMPWQLDMLPKRLHALIKPNYLKFYWKARADIEEVREKHNIACAHHFGPLALRYPTPLREFDLPYVIGPLGGSLPTPAAFRTEHARQPWYYRLRDVDGMRFRHDPWLRSSYERAACVVGVGDYVGEEVLSGVSLRRFETYSEIAAKPPAEGAEAVLASRADRRGPTRLLIVSRLIFSKGVQYALRAAAALPQDISWTIDILGDGPMRADLERLAASLGIAEQVTFRGFVTRARVEEFYRAADVFLFPSIREPSGAVIFEAMSWGLPMIAAHYGGPAAHIAPEFGIRVPIASESGFVNGLTNGIAELSRSSDKRLNMGRAALAAAEQRHSMFAMVEFYLDLYRRVGRGTSCKR